MPSSSLPPVEKAAVHGPIELFLRSIASAPSRTRIGAAAVGPLQENDRQSIPLPRILRGRDARRDEEPIAHAPTVHLLREEDREGIRPRAHAARIGRHPDDARQSPVLRPAGRGRDLRAPAPPARRAPRWPASVDRDRSGIRAASTSLSSYALRAAAPMQWTRIAFCACMRFSA